MHVCTGENRCLTLRNVDFFQLSSFFPLHSLTVLSILTEVLCRFSDYPSAIPSGSDKRNPRSLTYEHLAPPRGSRSCEITYRYSQNLYLHTLVDDLTSSVPNMTTETAVAKKPKTVGFIESFWSTDYAGGLGVLFQKLQQGVIENQQVLTIATMRADAEEMYSERLEDIAPSIDRMTGGFARDDGASVKKVSGWSFGVLGLGH